MKEILTHTELQFQIDKLADQLLTLHPDLSEVAFIGIQQGGVALADEIMVVIQKLRPSEKIFYGQLDITFYRDDIRKEILAPDNMHIPFSIEDKKVVLIDDVLFTGRTIKAALDVLLDYGRPSKVELCVLIDRREHRQFPIQADIAAMVWPTEKTDKVKLLPDDAGNKHVVIIGKQ
ncbi:MAG: bifunctional pyr operon transcriptional regulator/uracil phosphoribosyltransferase PyrR [Chitinophagaceae bacterium]|nr:bifunctional pyr operon transcriptional regulator/uracil phosphoribosyltransferase PyrR [Chitinophagaceae bacterium]MBL0057020.1 bifunctional pyr operon transcriptional regulator/uracil phosphoribosyltransferase PyrR [Chitinophagaceae bacterium]